MKKMAGKSSWVQYIYVLISVLLSLAAVEGILRIVDYHTAFCSFSGATLPETGYAQFDSITGWRYRESVSVKGDYGVPYIFNAEGYRSDSVDARTMPDKPVILIVGDSILFGHGLDFGNTFGYKLQKALDDKYQVVNFSVQAYGTDQMDLLMKELVPVYHPVFVITDYISDHDYRNMNADRREISPCFRFDATKPVFSLENGRLVQTGFPRRISDYFGSRLVLLWKTVLYKLPGARDKGRMMSERLLEDMNLYVSRNAKKMFIIVFDSPGIRVDGGNVLEIGMRDPENPLKYRISAKDDHPNAEGTTYLVERFLAQFGSDFGTTLRNR